MPKPQIDESRLTVYVALSSAERVLAPFDALPFKETTLTLSQGDVAAASAAYRFCKDALKRYPAPPPDRGGGSPRPPNRP
jgi:hypothetical protein